MAIEDLELKLQQELSRRVARSLPGNAPTGYDGDPNDATDAADIAYFGGAPDGTEYTSSTQRWKKDEGVWVPDGNADTNARGLHDRNAGLEDVYPCLTYQPPSVEFSPSVYTFTFVIDGGAPQVVAATTFGTFIPTAQELVAALNEALRVAGIDTITATVKNTGPSDHVVVYRTDPGGTLEVTASVGAAPNQWYFNDNSTAYTPGTSGPVSGLGAVTRAQLGRAGGRHALVGFYPRSVAQPLDFDVSIGGAAPVNLAAATWDGLPAAIDAAGLSDELGYAAGDALVDTNASHVEFFRVSDFYLDGIGALSDYRFIYSKKGKSLKVTTDDTVGGGGFNRRIWPPPNIEAPGAVFDEKSINPGGHIIPTRTGDIDLGQKAEAENRPAFILHATSTFNAASLSNTSVQLNGTKIDISFAAGVYADSDALVTYLNSQFATAGVDDKLEARNVDGTVGGGQDVAVGFKTPVTALGDVLEVYPTAAPSSSGLVFYDYHNDVYDSSFFFLGYGQWQGTARPARRAISFRRIVVDEVVSPGTPWSAHTGSDVAKTAGEVAEGPGGQTIGSYYFTPGSSGAIDVLRGQDPIFGTAPFIAVNVSSSDPLDDLDVEAGRAGDVVMGDIDAYGGRGFIRAAGFASRAFGAVGVWDNTAGNQFFLEAFNFGAEVWGVSSGDGGATGNYQSDGPGSRVGGYHYMTSQAVANIRATGQGAEILWSFYADGAGTVMTTNATGHGSEIRGYGYATGGFDLIITTSGAGSSFRGYAEASSQNVTITVSGAGATVWGNIVNGNASATAANAHQWGVGANSVADSAQFGTGWHFKFTADKGTLSQNGAAWIDSGGTAWVQSEGDDVPLVLDQRLEEHATSGDRAMTNADAGKHIRCTHASGVTIQIGDAINVGRSASFSREGGQLIFEPTGSMSLVVAPGNTAAVQATGLLTITANPSDNDTVQIDGRTYRFKNIMAAVNDVQIGGSAAATRTSLRHAINLTGTPGTDYFTGTTIHPTVSAADNGTQDLDATAKLQGTQGNAYSTTVPIGSYGTWGGTTLSGGVDITDSGANSTVTVIKKTATVAKILGELG